MTPVHGPGHGHDHPEHAIPLGFPAPLADASVRTGRVSDAPAVGLVQATVWREVYAGAVPPEVADQFDGGRFGAIWRRSLQDPPSTRHRLLVACAGDQVVGFAALAPASEEPGLPDGAGELTDLAVHPDARRSGHGSRLLNAAADTLRANDFTSVVCWVPAADDRARAFAASAGLDADGAIRDTVVGPEGQMLRQVRVRAAL